MPGTSLGNGIRLINPDSPQHPILFLQIRVKVEREIRSLHAEAGIPAGAIDAVCVTLDGSH
jgi:hypothetical protein